MFATIVTFFNNSSCWLGPWFDRWILSIRRVFKIFSPQRFSRCIMHGTAWRTKIIAPGYLAASQPSVQSLYLVQASKAANRRSRRCFNVPICDCPRTYKSLLMLFENSLESSSPCGLYSIFVASLLASPGSYRIFNFFIMSLSRVRNGNDVPSWSRPLWSRR